jgi:hypothetical protein
VAESSNIGLPTSINLKGTESTTAEQALSAVKTLYEELTANTMEQQAKELRTRYVNMTHQSTVEVSMMLFDGDSLEASACLAKTLKVSMLRSCHQRPC